MSKNYAKTHQAKIKKEKISLSFQFVDHSNDYFFMHGLSQKYYQHLTETFNNIQSITEDELRINDYNAKNLKPKAINFTSKNHIKSFPVNKDSSIYTYSKNLITIEENSSTEEKINAHIKNFTKNAFELSLSKNYGRIHGFIYANIFYIIWFDPAHNLFLSFHLGKQTKVEFPHNKEVCKPINPAKYQEYTKKLIGLQKDMDILFDEATR